MKQTPKVKLGGTKHLTTHSKPAKLSFINLGRLRSVKEKTEFRSELPLAVLNCWADIIKNPIIPGGPDAPGHEYDDLQRKRDPKSMSG
jgi:hypothetical protein